MENGVVKIVLARRGEAVIARSGATKQSRQRSLSRWIASPALTSGPLAMAGGARGARMDNGELIMENVVF
ncbi:MAG: hypothetical protein LBT00_11245 [Spirochaetaceae bacterium]|nr:hypothetical protein [Spirochaetaceae bacterium]